MKTNIYLISFFLLSSVLVTEAQTKVPQVLDPKPTTETDKKTVKTTAKPGDDFDMKAHTDSLALLQKKTEELNSMAMKIRKDAQSKPESVKKLLMSEASNLDQQSQVVQIAASNLSSKINNQKFNKNKSTIKTYVAKAGEQNVPQYTKNLIFDSEKIMRLAKEMREEANAQPNLASKLGTMSNADEQEEVAIGKQLEAMTNLERITHSSISAQK